MVFQCCGPRVQDTKKVSFKGSNGCAPGCGIGTLCCGPGKKTQTLNAGGNGMTIEERPAQSGAGCNPGCGLGCAAACGCGPGSKFACGPGLCCGIGPGANFSKPNGNGMTIEDRPNGGGPDKINIEVYNT